MGENARPAFDVITVSRDGKRVNFEGGVALKPYRSVTQVRKTDRILVPAVGLDSDPVLHRNQASVRWLRRQADKGSVIGGAGSGVALLAEAGLLNGREATTHWVLADAFRVRFPDVDRHPEKLITHAGNVFCSGGAYAALDLSLHLVERSAGYEVSRECGRALLIDAPRAVQAGYANLLIKQKHHDEKIRPAQQYMADNSSAQFSVDDLARCESMSARNFARRFKQATGDSPLSYLHKLRIDRARQLLESDFKFIQEICYEVGYEDVPFFRAIFKGCTGTAPKEYRQCFSAAPRLE